MKQMSISSILKTTDNQVTRMVDRLALDQQQKAYLDSIDSYINLSRSVFCRKKTVDQHIEYLQEKHAQNMKDTHYVVQPKQIQNAMGNIINSLKNDQLINKLKTLNQDIEEKLNAFNEEKKKRNEMIDEYGEEYKKLRQDLIKDYQTKCDLMQNETKKQIEEIQEKYKIMNECIPELTIEQLKAENSFRKTSRFQVRNKF